MQDVHRSRFLEAFQGDDPSQILEMVTQHHSKQDNVDLDEIIKSLSGAELDRIWTQVCCLTESNICQALVAGSEEECGEVFPDKESEKSIQILHAVAVLAHINIRVGICCLPRNLVQTVAVLHELLPVLLDSQTVLKNKICDVCQEWWLQGLEGKEQLIINTLIHNIQKTLSSRGTKTSVKQVWLVRDAFLEVISQTSSNSEVFFSLLTQCVTSPVYLNSKEGQHLLSFVFGLDLHLTAMLHGAVKKKLPSCTMQEAEAYGNIYLKAWQDSCDPYRKKIANDCIQNLIYHALHAQRNIQNPAGKDVFSLIRKVLNVFHQEKRQMAVSTLLVGLYEPLLWRSLKVANGCVRLNATTLFFDVFPLEAMDSAVEVADLVMQKHFRYMKDLLVDACPCVRIAAVTGTCQVLQHQWEIVPLHVIQHLCLLLCDDLACDSSNANVREAVAKGFICMLENPLTHQVLNTVLPKLTNLFHDVSTKVRVAFCDVLLKVKGICFIKYWKVVPVEHLLARLEDDSVPICRRIVKLICKSYLPVAKSNTVKLDRITALIKMSRPASRVFFQHLHLNLKLQDIVNAMILYSKAVVIYAKRMLDSDHKFAESYVSEGKENRPNNFESNSNLNDSSFDEDFPLNNPDVTAGLLDAVTIMWTSVKNSLLRAEHLGEKNHLEKMMAKYIPTFLRAFKGSVMWDSAVYLGSFLPSSSLPTFGGLCFSQLRAFPEDSTPEVFGVTLEAMCIHGRIPDVMELIIEWLEPILNSSKKFTSRRQQTKGKKKVTFQEPYLPKPLLVVKYLTFLLQQHVCREILLKSHRALLKSMWEHLMLVKRPIVSCMAVGADLSTQHTDKLLTEIFSLCCKLTILLNSEDYPEDINAVTIFQDMFSWAIVAIIKPLQLEMQENASQHSDSLQRIGLATGIVKELVTFVAVMYSLDLSNLEFASSLTEFVFVAFQTDLACDLVAVTSDVLYNYMEHLPFLEDNSAEQYRKLASVLTSCILRTLLNCSIADAQSAVKNLSLWPTTFKALQKCPCREIWNETIAIIAASILAEITLHVDTHGSMEPCNEVTNLPPLSSVLLLAMTKNDKSVEQLIMQVGKYINLHNIERPSGCLAAVHLLHAISKDGRIHSSKQKHMKEAVKATKVLVAHFSNVKDETSRTLDATQLSHRHVILETEALLQLPVFCS